MQSRQISSASPMPSESTPWARRTLHCGHFTLWAPGGSLTLGLTTHVKCFHFHTLGTRGCWSSGWIHKGQAPTIYLLFGILLLLQSELSPSFLADDGTWATLRLSSTHRGPWIPGSRSPTRWTVLLPACLCELGQATASELQVFTIKCKICTSPGHVECVLWYEHISKVLGRWQVLTQWRRVSHGRRPLPPNTQQDPHSPFLTIISHCANQPQCSAQLSMLQNHSEGLAPRAVSNLQKSLGDLGLQPPALMLWASGSPSLGPSVQGKAESDSPIQHYSLTHGRHGAPGGKGSCLVQRLLRN